MPDDTYKEHPDATARRQKKEADEQVDKLRKQEEVNTNLRKQAMAEVKETIAMMREMDAIYTVTADEIAAMVDDRVARMKAGGE